MARKEEESPASALIFVVALPLVLFSFVAFNAKHFAGSNSFHLQDRSPELEAQTSRSHRSNDLLDAYLLRNCELRWTADAEQLIIRQLEGIQHPTSCDTRKLVVEMDVSGLLWNFQSFVRALALGLQLNRTVIPVRRALGGPHWEYAAFDGCGDTQHLGCYFPKITSCQAPENLNYSTFWTWDFDCRPCLQDLIVGTKDTDVLFLKPLNASYSGWAPDLFDKELWNNMNASPCKYFETCNSSFFHAAMNAQPPIFMLHSIISTWMFDNTERQVQLEGQILEANSGWQPPVAAIHIRRTDKMTEDPFWNSNNNSYRSTQDYINALTNATASQKSWKSVFVMTDSEQALEEFKLLFQNGGNAAVMFNRLANRTIIEKAGGHVNIPMELKYGMQLEFLSTMSVVRQISDFAVGALSSNVFRVLLQLIGAKHRCAQSHLVGPLAFSFDTTKGSEGWTG